ncbi:hypothetical protein HW132_33775 [Brasilonema sp. CT11]|nr:hypothetical protein [Brasilonema sp. CT11]
MNDDTTKTAIASLLIAVGLSIGLVSLAKFFTDSRPQIHLQIRLDIE